MPISDRMASRGIIRKVFWQKAKIRQDQLPSGDAGKESISIVCINTKYFSFDLSYPTFSKSLGKENFPFSICSLLFFNLHDMTIHDILFRSERFRTLPHKRHGQSETGNYGYEKMLCPIPNGQYGYGYGIGNTDYRI